MEQVAVAASTSTSPTTAQQSSATTAAKTEGKTAEVLMLDSSDDDDAGKRKQREGDSSSENEADDDEEAKDANSKAKAKSKVASKKRGAPCTHPSPKPSRLGIETDRRTYCPAAPASSSSTPAAKKSKSDKNGAGGNKFAQSELPQQQKGTETPPLVVIKKGASKFEIRQKPLKTDLAQSYTTGAFFFELVLYVCAFSLYLESLSR